MGSQQPLDELVEYYKQMEKDNNKLENELKQTRKELNEMVENNLYKKCYVMEKNMKKKTIELEVLKTLKTSTMEESKQLDNGMYRFF